MNTPTDIPTHCNPSTTELDDSNSIKIAIVLELKLWLPQIPTLVMDSARWLGLESPLFMVTAARMLERHLRHEGVMFDEVSWWGFGCDGVIRFRTIPAGREKALSCAVEFVTYYPILDGLATVASYCSAEEAWREHHRFGPQIDLHEFFSPKRQEIRRGDLERFQQTIKLFLDTAHSLEPPLTPQ